MISDILSAARYEKTTTPGWNLVEVEVPAGISHAQVLDALADKHMTVVPVFSDSETPIVAKVCG